MTTGKSYSPEQQIHSISSLSNAAFDLQEDSFSDLQNTTTKIVTDTLNDSDIKSLIGDWTLIWGPIVFSNNTSAAKVVADNTMMLVYNTAQNLFVVGIAGTNAVSMYGWMQEDFQVNTLVKWEDIVNKSVSKDIAISGGTNTGLEKLLGMTGTELTTNSSNEVAMLTALNNYATTNKITDAEVAVAGHSLGGALSPTMALYMQDTLATWNTGKNISKITAWPTAGPTPGNADFATYLSASMGSNYTSRYNTLDVVPQAWQSSTMEQIPEIYNGSIPYPESAAPFSTTIGTLTAAAFLRTINTGALIPLPIIYQQALPWHSMTGTFDKDTDSTAVFEADIVTALEPSGLAPYKPYLVFLYRFLKQMLFQHTTAYNTLLDIADFATDFSNIKKGIVGQSEQELQSAAFYKALNKYYGLPDLSTAITKMKKEQAVLS